MGRVWKAWEDSGEMTGSSNQSGMETFLFVLETEHATKDMANIEEMTTYKGKAMRRIIGNQ